MTEFKANKAGLDVADFNANRMLSGISYSPKDSNQSALKLVGNEMPRQESFSGRTSSPAPPKEALVEVTQEKIVSFPFPQESYNPNRCPPDLIKASKHGFAHRVTRYDATHWLGEVCESTGLPIIFKKLELLCSMTHLYFLGPVVPMYFLFVKQLGFIALLLSCIPIAILLTDDEPYTWDYENNMEILFDDRVTVYILCSFAAVIVFFVVMYMFRKSQKVVKTACKKSMVTPNDYTIMAYNMGDSYTEEEIRAFFGNYIIPGFSLDLCKIAVTYDIERYIHLMRRLKNLTKMKKETEEEETSFLSASKLKSIQEEIDEIRAFLIQNNSLIAGGKGLMKNGLSFVTFNTKQEAKSVRRKFEFSILERVMVWLLEKCTDEFPEYFFKENYINVEKAPEINEVLWENLNCNTSQKGLGLLTILVQIILYAISFIALSLIKHTEVSGNSYLMAFVVMVVNEVIGFAISFLASYERFKTTTEWNIALEQRTALAQFINSVVPIIVLDLIVSPVSSAEFSFDVVTISIMICILPILLRFLNIPYLRKVLQRRTINAQVKANSGGFGITQEEANHAYEDPEFNIPNLYADNMKTFLFTCFFFSVSPGIAIIALISYILSYCVDKYNLLRRSLLPSSLRSEVAEAIFEFVDFGIFLLALGTNLLFKLQTSTTSSDAVGQSISIAISIVALIYLVLPHKRFARHCFGKKKKTAWPDVLFYQQAVDYFSGDYQSFNPISKEPRNPKESQELFRSMLTESNSVPDLREAPDLIPLLHYAMKRPSLAEVRRELDGLRNPFYIFPQNYAYGATYFAAASVLGKDNNAAIKAPLMEESIEKSPLGGQKRIIKFNEMVPSLGSSLEIKEKTFFGSHSNKGNSIMKDILLFPSFNGKTAIGIRFSNTSNMTNQKDGFMPSLEETSIEKPIDQRNMLSAFSPSQNSSGIIDGISPITETWMNTSDQKARERPLIRK